jgi:hypothetical protein
VEDTQHDEGVRPGVLQAVRLAGRKVHAAAGGQRVVGPGVRDAPAGQHQDHLVVGVGVLGGAAGRDLADELGSGLAASAGAEQDAEPAVAGDLRVAVGQVDDDRVGGGS